MLNLRGSLACELTAHLIRAWLAFETFWRNFFDWDFRLRGILFKKRSWAWFFRRPLYQCDFEIFSTTPQLDPNRKPIWFCKCKLRYTVWEIWECQLVHMRFWAILKQLLGSSSSSSSSRSICEGRGVVVFCIVVSRSAPRLVGWLVGYLVWWLVGWLLGWLVGLLVG